jgi:membrane fusion protein (multidrug efflux system)
MQTKQSRHSIGRYRAMFGACALVLVAACGKPKQEAAVQLPPPKVEAAEVVQETVPIAMDFAATVKAVKSVDIIPRVSGYIIERYFQEGDFVKEGASLYLIDPRPYQADLEAAQAKLAQDQASLQLWESEAKRYTRLAKKGAGSVEDKEKAIAHREEYKAAIAQDQADIDNAKLNLGYTHITAPFQGRIQQTRINVGQLVQEQKDVLTTLVQMDPIYVVFNVSRAQSYEVQKLRHEGLGRQTLAEYEAHVKLPDGSPYPKQGHLDYVSAQVDPSTDAFEARAVFPNRVVEGRDADLTPGQYTPLTLIVGHRPDTLLIPQAALIQSQAGMHVYVLGKDNKVEHRKVEVGNAYQHYWIIDKGIKKGEKVIVKGVQKVKQGMSVTVAEPATKGSGLAMPHPPTLVQATIPD